MDFIKKHYEKILLGAVLLGLTLALAFLPVKIANERQDLENIRQTIINVTIKPLLELDLRPYEATLQQVQNPFALNFSDEHNLFNPVRWQRTPDGRLLKEQNAKETGPEALTVAKISPLYLIVSFESTNTSGFLVKVEKETITSSKGRTVARYISLEKPKTENLLLRNVRGGGAQPFELDLDLLETGEKISIAMGKPFRRVDGYTADLKYPPDNLTWTARREGQALRFAGDEYTIRSIKEVAPGEFEIVLSSKSTDKKYIIKYKP